VRAAYRCAHAGYEAKSRRRPLRDRRSHSLSFRARAPGRGSAV